MTTSPSRVLERDAVEAELVDPLPTPAAGRRGDRDLLQVTRSAARDDRARDRCPLRADAERIGGILDVHALEEPPVARLDDGPDVEVRVRRVRTVGRGDRLVIQLVAHPNTWNMTRTASAPEHAAVDDLDERVHARLDPCLGDEHRHQERERGDQEPVLRVADHLCHRHPAAERDRGVTRRKPSAQRGPATCVRLRAEHEDDHKHERDHGQLRGGVPQPLDQPRAPVREGVGEDEVADGDGVHGRDQDGARGDVLGELGERVEGGRHHVDPRLERRVDHLGDQDERDREQQGDQLDPPHSGRDGRDQHRSSDREVDAHVPLRAQHVNHALEREVEALQQRGASARRGSHHTSSDSRRSISAPWS